MVWKPNRFVFLCALCEYCDLCEVLFLHDNTSSPASWHLCRGDFASVDYPLCRFAASPQGGEKGYG